MRHLLTGLLVFAALFGLNLRAAAQYDRTLEPCAHEHVPCDHSHDSPSDSQSHSHDSDCPAGPHHHVCGGHHLPLAANDLLHPGVISPSARRLVVVHESELPPDGPFAALDKPPLI